MSTTSRIKIKRLDGSEKAIYCHWDGYVQHNGLYLQLCYDTPEKIEKLLELGNISSLGETLETTNAYARYRGETIEFWDSEQEFNYTFDENKGVWIVEQYHYSTIVCNNINSNYEYTQKTTRFLIDEIMQYKDELVEHWEDDEFATKENIIEVLLEKAKAQAEIANKRIAEEYDWWYRAYCD